MSAKRTCLMIVAEEQLMVGSRNRTVFVRVVLSTTS